MCNLEFNEPRLVNTLERLSNESRLAFACACAERMLPTYRTFSTQVLDRDDTELLRDALDLLQRDITGNPASVDELDKNLELCMSLMPNENIGKWVPERITVEGALMATAYALRCRQNADPHEAAWAARRAYEALEFFVVGSENIRENAFIAKPLVLSHPVVQAELARQQRDLNELLCKTVGLNQLLERARSEGRYFLQNN